MKKIYSNIEFVHIDFTSEDLPFEQIACKTSGEKNGICKCINNSNNPKNICFRPKGYLMMCRFFSGIMQNHPVLKKYESYFRFDDDSFLIEPFLNQTDFLDKFKDIDYGFRSIFYESRDQSSLWEFTKEYIKKICDKKKISFENYLLFLEQRNIINNGNYNGISPYNNFHYSKLSLWKNNEVKEYINKIHEIHGCLLNNWMDANIHAMIIFVISPLLELNVEPITNFGYRHNRHFSIINNLNIVYKNNEDFFIKYDL